MSSGSAAASFTEAGGHRHFGGGLFAGEKGGLQALRLRELPEHAVAVLAAVGLPGVGEGNVVERPLVDDELVADGFGFALGDGPVAGEGPARADAHLRVDVPRQRIAGIFRMIEDGDVRLVAATGELQADIDPNGALAVGAFVALAVAVDHGACRAGAPGHAHEKPAVVVLRDRQIDEAFAFPFEIEEVAIAAVPHGPGLGLGHDRLPRGVEEMVDGGPFYFATLRDEHRGGDAAPVAAGRILGVVAAVDAGEPPIKAGLVRVMVRAEFAEDALPVGRDDRMQVRPEIGPGVLSEDRLRDLIAIDGEGVRGGILTQCQIGRVSGGQGGGQEHAGEAEEGRHHGGGIKVRGVVRLTFRSRAEARGHKHSRPLLFPGRRRRGTMSAR